MSIREYTQRYISKIRKSGKFAVLKEQKVALHKLIQEFEAKDTPEVSHPEMLEEIHNKQHDVAELESYTLRGKKCKDFTISHVLVLQ